MSLTRVWTDGIHLKFSLKFNENLGEVYRKFWEEGETEKLKIFKKSMKLNWNFSRDRVDSGPAIYFCLKERYLSIWSQYFLLFLVTWPHALFRTGEASPIFLENVFLKSGVPSAQVLDFFWTDHRHVTLALVRRPYVNGCSLPLNSVLFKANDLSWYCPLYNFYRSTRWKIMLNQITYPT